MASESFARIRAQVLELTAQVPYGRVTTFHAIGAHIAVAPRHVAFLLVKLSEEEKSRLPWYRVVADGGLVPSSKTEQRQLLAAEGAKFAQARIVDFARRFVAMGALAQKRR